MEQQYDCKAQHVSTIANTDVHTRAVYTTLFVHSTVTRWKSTNHFKKFATQKIVQRITHHVRSAALWVRERERARTKHDGTSVGKSVVHWASLGNLLFTALSLG